MKIIIAGSRDAAQDVSYFGIGVCIGTLTKFSKITEIVSGTARGVDTFGEEIAARYGFPVKKFPADWDKHGRGAGYVRNAEMADYADGLIAIWDGKSSGTKNMIQEMHKRSKPVWMYKI